MARFTDWFNRVDKRRTPRMVAVLIVVVLLGDLLLLAAIGKNLLVPFSKTDGEYVTWLGTLISFATDSPYSASRIPSE
jgi:hypothetical protein